MAMRPAPTRRQVLQAVTALTVGGTLAACTGPDERPDTDPDVVLRADAVAREQDLLQAYDALLATAPSDSALLRGLRAEHAAHLVALDPLAAVPSSGPSVAAPDRAALRALERAAAAQHGEAAVTARRTLAGLLASLSACEGAHLVVLA